MGFLGRLFKGLDDRDQGADLDQIEETLSPSSALEELKTTLTAEAEEVDVERLETLVAFVIECDVQEELNEIAPLLAGFAKRNFADLSGYCEGELFNFDTNQVLAAFVARFPQVDYRNISTVYSRDYFNHTLLNSKASEVPDLRTAIARAISNTDLLLPPAPTPKLIAASTETEREPVKVTEEQAKLAQALSEIIMNLKKKITNSEPKEELVVAMCLLVPILEEPSPNLYTRMRAYLMSYKECEERRRTEASLAS